MEKVGLHFDFVSVELRFHHGYFGSASTSCRFRELTAASKHSRNWLLPRLIVVASALPSKAKNRLHHEGYIYLRFDWTAFSPPPGFSKKEKQRREVIFLS